jgi:hypothetical protein
MTATGQESRDPQVGGPTIAAWRHRQEAYPSVLPSPSVETPDGHHATTDRAGIDSPDQIACDFAASQQAGLAAMISLARAGAPIPPNALDPLPPRLEPQGSPQVQAASATSSRSATALTQPAPPIDPPEVFVSAVLSVNGTDPSGERRTSRTGHRPAHLPGLLLIAILTVQAVLSLRLVWSNTAFLDEATYLYAGHVELAHWLHGAPAPAFATYFSGAPVIYPPLAALAASIGGLTAARVLSLAFMLSATALLWSTTSRLFGKQAAFFAAALFALLGPTQTLGAFATYDAMALFLLAASIWCVVSAKDRDDSTLLLVAGILLLALANATKYATALFDPAVVALAAFTVAERRGIKPALARGGYIAAGALGLISALLALGGPWYLTGVLSTTVARAIGDNSPLLVLTDAWKWIGLTCVVAGLGVVLCIQRRLGWAQVMILATLCAAGTLVPLNQARIHTTTSLFKQVDFGAWLAAVAAGYALAQLFRMRQRRWLGIGVAGLASALAITLTGFLGPAAASDFFKGWPNSTQTVAVIRSVTQSHPGNYLAEDYNVPAYYLESTIPWQRWSQTWYFTYRSPGTHRILYGASAYHAAIDAGYFSLIILNFTDTAPIDSRIIAYMRQAGTYHLVAAVPIHDKFFNNGQELIWAYEPSRVQREGNHDHH